ncbi:YqjC family protein [Tatumella ptyseos ATCC 33301]|uniref:YqjC family protein n=2 Tax=Tatumella ptyseos TaxID=82987 RepID=A0A085JKS1_9GAMM|nr:DUF1090 domain-containing protein [Tatumella ptyseos]KFD21067.1 YqjC family protein [Tatumella ptyseos ATCC 33301]SQK76901.1 Protein of uncharacterised function (DUF1090) [Tatumella ptyseos]
MKKVMTVLSLSVLSLLTMNALAAETCTDKRIAIEKEMGYARQHNNTGKLAGLEKALDQVNTHCSPESVRQDAHAQVEKLQKKQSEKQADVKAAEEELQQAIRRGNKDKIRKYQDKVAEKKQELSTLTRRLDQSRSDLSALK